MGLSRHDGEVEGVVLEDDAVLIVVSVAAHAMLKRMSQKDDAIAVFYVCLRAGFYNMRNLPASLARP